MYDLIDKFDDNLLTRSFNKSITNSLLFSDILTFNAYLTEDIEPKSYAAKLESIIIGTLYQSLNSKSKISDYDKEIIDIFYIALDKHWVFIRYVCIKG